jgi:hypothetical protein
MDLQINDIPSIVRKLFPYLVNMFCGFIIIANIYYVFYGSNYYSYGEKLLQVIDYVTENILILILFLITSLILGYICEQLVDPISIKCKKLFEWRGAEIVNAFKVEEIIHRKENSYLIDNLRNRAIGLRITRSIGVTSLISSAILLISFIFKLITIQNFKLFDLLIGLFFFAITIGCRSKFRTDDDDFIEKYNFIAECLMQKEKNERKEQ